MANPGDIPAPMDTTLRRIVVAWRLLALVWMTGLVVETLIADDAANRAVVAATLAVAVSWTALTVLMARDRARFVSWWWLALDGVVTLWIALAPLVADSENTFFGGYPLSWLILVVYAAYDRWVVFGGLSAALLIATQVVDEVVREGGTNVVGEVAVHIVTWVVFGWGMRALRRNEALRIAAQAGLDEERRKRIRADDRAEIAAHLHDSVLQTLSLVRQRADDPRDVRDLVRRQERDLRQWLDEISSEYDDSFSVAVRAAGWEVEDTYRLRVDAVTVGDCQLDDRSRAVVNAAREALVNAAKFANVDRISLFSEVGAGRASVYVRDRGSGFAPAESGDGHRGIAYSIVARMERHGGTAVVHSEPGQGTEVELVMPLVGT